MWPVNFPPLVHLPTLALVALLWQSPVSMAQLPDTVFLEELTWTEVREAIAQGHTTIIFPTGGTEQNGPHMALGKHNAIVRYAAERIARRLGNALVAPVLAYVPQGEAEPPTGHMRFPGTITVPEETFRSVTEHAARSFKASGFTDVVLLGDSGGNWSGLEAVATVLNREWADSRVRVHYIAAYNRGRAFRDWLRSQGETIHDIGTHAGIMDTSVLMAVQPDWIREEELAPGADFTATGVAGNPTRASAEYGRKGLELMIEGAVSEIRRVTAMSR